MPAKPAAAPVADEFAATATGTPDAKGTPFDPEKHQKLRTGRGLLNRAKEWVKKGGRPKADAATAPAAPVAGSSAPATGAPEGNLMADIIADSPKAIPAGENATVPLAEGMPEIKGADDAPPAPPPNASALDSEARAVVLTIESVARMFLGPDIEHAKEERDELTAAWRAYLETTGGLNLPPWTGIAIAYTALVSRRWERPTFRDRIMGWFGKKK